MAGVENPQRAATVSTGSSPGLEHPPGQQHPLVGEPQVRRGAGLVAEPARERAGTHRRAGRERLDGVVLVERLEQLLEQRRERLGGPRTDRHVDVLSLAAVAVRGHHHAAGRAPGQLLAMVGADQVQAQVEARGSAGGGEHRPVADEQDVRVDLGLGVQRLQLGRVAPVRRAPAAIEHAGRAERERARAEAHHLGAAGDGLADQREHRLVHRLVGGLVERRDDHQVGVVPRGPAGRASLIVQPAEVSTCPVSDTSEQS